MPSMYLGESKVWHELSATCVIPWIKQNHEAGDAMVMTVLGFWPEPQMKHWKGPKWVCQQQVDMDLPKAHLIDNWVVVSNMAFIFHNKWDNHPH